MENTQINTNGGVVVQGNVHPGSDFIGRDKIENHIYTQTTQMNLDMVELNKIGDVLIEAFRELREWGSRRQAQSDLLEEKELKAVQVFQDAVIKSSDYLGRLKNGESRNHERQAELVNLWSVAAIAFYGINEKIAPLLHLKAFYLSGQADWIDLKMTEAGITLAEMNDLLMQVLKKGTALP